MRLTHLERISNSYNKQHASAFSRKSSERRFLVPWKLSLGSLPPEGFGDHAQRLSSKEEFDLFAALHFIKYRIKKAFRKSQIERYYKIYLAIRNKGVTCNWPLVASCVEKRLEKIPPNVDIANLFEQGYFALLSAVDCFDPWYGYKLSTYACNSIQKGFYRRKKTLKTETLNTFIDIAAPDETDENEEWLIENLLKMLKTNVLTPREKKILELRFGFNCEKWNLQEVGNSFGITKERARQIQCDALKKLRKGFTVIDL